MMITKTMQMERKKSIKLKIEMITKMNIQDLKMIMNDQNSATYGFTCVKSGLDSFYTN